MVALRRLRQIHAESDGPGRRLLVGSNKREKLFNEFVIVGSTRTAYFEQHLAAALNMGHGVMEGRERIGCRDGSVDRAGCNERHALTHRRGDLWLELRIALKKTLRNYSLCDQIHWVDRRRLSAHQRVGDDSAALGERACNGGCRRSGDAIDTERYPPVTNRLTHLVQNASLVDEHDVAARSLELRDKLWRLQ